jgi:hypothetical protein
VAATTAGALKVLIEGLSTGLMAYADQPPTGKALPYVLIHRALGAVPDPLEDGKLTTGTEPVQIEVLQAEKDEVYSVVPTLLAGLHGARLAPIGTPTPTKITYCVLVRNQQRVLDLQDLTVRDIIDVDVKREL